MSKYHMPCKAQRIAFYNEWKKPVGRELSDVYRNPSINKSKAYKACRSLFAAGDESTNFGILSFNSQTFSVAWACFSPEHVWGLHVETAYNSYFIPFAQLLKDGVKLS